MFIFFVGVHIQSLSFLRGVYENEVKGIYAKIKKSLLNFKMFQTCMAVINVLFIIHIIKVHIH